MHEREQIEDPAAALVTPSGRPARAAKTDRCPQCAAGSETRIASSGFGTPHPVCRVCGYEWHGEVFRG